MHARTSPWNETACITLYTLHHHFISIKYPYTQLLYWCIIKVSG